MTPHQRIARAQALLSSGLATIAEVAVLADVSRQTARYWARDIPWREARDAAVRELWAMPSPGQSAQTHGPEHSAPPAERRCGHE